MQHTSMYNNGYRYYVYVAPGYIEYFKKLQEALDYQNEHGGNLGEVN